MEDETLEEMIIDVLEDEAGKGGMRSKGIQRYLPIEEVSAFKIGKICGNSENIRKVRENSEGGRWHIDGKGMFRG